jgi:hypothetical protein
VSLIYAVGVQCFECRECLVYNFFECRESYLDERALAGGEWRPAYTYISRRGASLIASHFGEIFAVLCPVY